MFLLCASSCFRATEEEEQGQSKKGLKKQQKEAEKAAKKAEKQAKLVSVFFLFLFLLVFCFTSVATPYSWQGCDAVFLGIVSPRGLLKRAGGEDYLLLKYSCHFGFVYVHPNKVLFSSTPSARHVTSCMSCMLGGTLNMIYLLKYW